MREASFERCTKETEIKITLNLDAGERQAETGVGFFDHMLLSFLTHGGFSGSILTKGDLQVDAHHTVEDTGIVLGKAFAAALGSKAGIRRFGSAMIPMDEALCTAVADLSGRPFFFFHDEPLRGLVMPGFDAGLAEEFFRAFAFGAEMTLHLKVEYGKNAHHMVEGLFKAAARALRDAVKIEGSELPSTKGVL